MRPAGIVVSDVTLPTVRGISGSLFLACKGRRHHGVQFAEQAVAPAPRAVLYERNEEDRDDRVPSSVPTVFAAAFRS